MAYPSRGNPISFNQINIELGHSGTAQLSLSQAGLEEFGQTLGTEIEICQFFSDGCPNAFIWPFNVNSYQADDAGEYVQTTWLHAGSLPFTLVSYTVWIKVDTGSWVVLAASVGTPSTATAYLDTSSQPGHDVYTRVQAIGSSQKSPPDADMDNTGTTYPETALTVTEDNTPTE